MFASCYREEPLYLDFLFSIFACSICAGQGEDTRCDRADTEAEAEGSHCCRRAS